MFSLGQPVHVRNVTAKQLRRLNGAVGTVIGIYSEQDCCPVEVQFPFESASYSFYFEELEHPPVIPTERNN
jgi:hypothetical protein